MCVKASSFAALEAAAITRAPSALPTWIAAAPVPPAAPSTSSVSSAFSVPRFTSAKYAVALACRNTAAPAKSMFAGMRASCTGASVMSSA